MILNNWLKLVVIPVFICSLFIPEIPFQHSNTVQLRQDTIIDETARHLAANGLKGLVVAPGLEISMVATEPMLINPTNIDVDERGRVWVTEAYNYRPMINGNPTRKEGDRIVILQDNNGDGKSDESKVFYQGPEINAPLGICVLGRRVLVSQSPYVWALYDDNGDDKADRKEILFQGIGGEQHDHGMHTFTFGPDGKLYFNFGNEGKTLKDKNGKVVLDQDGDEIGPGKYQQGMLFRCDPDGSNVECLAQNFRNNYELAVDSYGTIWQSDNDDDGNRGVRINYVMPYGNYGYRDEFTGASWQASRTNMEDSLPQKHWHLNDPGVVPNLLHTGAGSPTGMIVYEGSLLPEPFINQMIHCDAGPNVVRAYPVKKQGAGYSASIINLVKGENDQWFRPADVSVAPDGSLIIADWYDPGVGGHQAGDQQRGRIYRVAPQGSSFSVPAYDFSTAAGAVKALQNPNLAVRHHAWTALQQLGNAAVGELETLWRSGAEPRMRARALWMLSKTNNGKQYINEALENSNADLRITGLRAAKEVKADMVPLLSKLVNDPDPQVRRECALALHHLQVPQAPALWTALAKQYEGNDRWYLEALGIGADRQWDAFFAAYLQEVNDPLKDKAGRDLVWRARTDKAVPYLAQLAGAENETLTSRLRYFRAFDFNKGPAKSTYLVKMIEDNQTNNAELNKLVLHHLNAEAVMASPVAKKALQDILKQSAGTGEYLELVRQYELKSENPKLLELAISKSDQQIGRSAAALLLQQNGAALMRSAVTAKDTVKTQKALNAISRVGSKESIDILQQVALSPSYPISVRRRATENMGRSMSGEDRVLELLRNKKLPAELIPSAVAGVKNAWRKAVYTEATSYLPASKKEVTGKKVPTLAQLSAAKGNKQSGLVIFQGSCAVCHQAGNVGFNFGPKLTEIGSKLAPEGLLDAIVHPSSGISFGFETWQLNMKDGSVLTGIIASRTESEIELRYPGGATQKIKTSDLKSVKQLPVSMMPEGLHENLTTKQLADLMMYLSSLKKAEKV